MLRRSLLSKLADAFLSCCRGGCVALLCFFSATLQVSGSLVCTYYLFWFCLFTVVQLHKLEKPKSLWFRNIFAGWPAEWEVYHMRYSRCW